jgi:sugar fermentation stimulation protein A
MSDPGPHKGSWGLYWPALVRGRLIRRYRRFLADVQLDGGETVTAHCPNTGSMTGCCEPGRPVYLSTHDNHRRKLKYTWELIAMPTSMVGVNTLVPNRLVAGAVAAGQIGEVAGYNAVQREATVGHGSRIDLRLTGNHRPCYVEIKNCTMVEGEGAAAVFPDAVTARGRRHLEELQRLVGTGNRCVMFYLVQRMDARCFRPADHIDAQYGRALRRAADGGVEILAYDVHIDLKAVRLGKRLPVHL